MVGALHDNDDNATGKNNNNNNNIEGSIIGRRGWIGSIVTTATVTATATIAGLARPTHASDPLPAAVQSFPASAAATVITSKAVCDPAVSVWKKNGRVIYLLGTAHISSSSAALAGQLVRDTTPTGVFIELDPKRVSGSGILSQKFNNNNNNEDNGDSSPARAVLKVIVPKISVVDGDGGLVLASLSPSSNLPNTDITATTMKAAKPIPPNNSNNNNNPIMKAATAAVGKSIKGLYQRLDSAGFESGEEFVTAVNEGRKVGSSIVLGDRDVEVTLRRVTEGLAKTDLKAFLSSDSELERTLQGLSSPMNDKVAAKLSGASSSSASDAAAGKELTDEQFRVELGSFVETMKTKDNVRTIMGQLQRVAPFLYEALVSERDVYMATGLNGLNELESIVAVVGIAHADGIENSLQLNGWQQKTLACSKYS